MPNNSLGKSAVRMLRSNDVHCTPVILSTPEETPTHRLGTYYLETGYAGTGIVPMGMPNMSRRDQNLARTQISRLTMGHTL